MGWLQQSSAINTDCRLLCISPACFMTPPARTSSQSSPGQQWTRTLYFDPLLFKFKSDMIDNLKKINQRIMLIRCPYIWFDCGVSRVVFLLTFYFMLICRHSRGSDMSSTSFWLRVALGSAVVTVLGFAIYRVIVRLKWSPTSFYCLLIHPWRPNVQDQIHKTHRKLFIPVLCLRVGLCHFVLHFRFLHSISVVQRKWNLVITLFSLLPNISALFWPSKKLFKITQVLNQSRRNAGRVLLVRFYTHAVFHNHNIRKKKKKGQID